MKYIVTIALTLFLTAFAMTQGRDYISTYGKTKTAAKWTEERRDGRIYLYTVQSGEKHEYILGGDYKTESWKIVNTFSNTNLSIRLSNDMCSISDKFDGRQISRTVKNKGKPWYQNIAHNVGLALKNSESVGYECFRPDNMKLYTMLTTNKGSEKFDGKDAIRTEATPTGFMSAFWSCDCYFDTNSMMFVRYEGVNGAPGTPEMRISVAR